MKANLLRFLDRYPDFPTHAALIGWTVLIASVWWLDDRNTRAARLEFARAEARAACRTDLAYNRWIASVGGIYARVTESNLPIARLARIPDRDARTADGGTLTLINPGCVVDIVHSRAHPNDATHAHIVGLGPPHADAHLDAWTRDALRELTHGKDEVSGYHAEGGTNLFRFMAALRTQDGCLKCHEGEGFQAGQLQGGIRIDVPLDSPAFAASQREQGVFTIGIWLVWLLGIAGGQGTHRLVRLRRAEREQAFRELSEREEGYRNVVEGSPDGFWLVDGDRRIVEVNEVYLRRSGYTREELLKRHIEDVEALETPERTHARIEQLRREGSAVFDTAHRAKDGTIWPVEAKVTYTPAFGGRFAAFFRDLSRHNRSDLLMRIRGQLADLAQTATLDEVLQSALDQAERVTGSTIGFFHFVDPDQEHLTLQTWSTRTLREMCTAEGKGQHYPVSQAGVWVECLKTGKPVIHNDYATLPHKRGLPPGHAPVVRELVVPVNRSGRILAIMGVGNRPTPYTDDETGLVDAIASMVTDLALRKRAQDELAQAFRIVPDLICIADSGGNIRQVNPEWERGLGIPASSLVSRRFIDFIHPADRRATLRGFATVARGRPVQRFINRFRAADGTYRWLEWNAGALSGENLVFAAARDITERHHAEQLATHQAALGAALMAGEDPTAILQRALDIAIEAAGMECGGLYLRDRQTGDMVMPVHRNLSETFVERVRHCPADSRKARLVVANDAVFARYQDIIDGSAQLELEEGLRALAVVTIRHGNQVLGCLNVASRSADDVPEPARRRLQVLVPQIGSVIARIHAETALRESERQMRLLFDGATDAIFRADAATGLITHCNRAAETLLGRPRAEIVGMPCSAAHPPEEVERCAAVFAASAARNAQGTLEPLETEVVRPDGTRRHVLISASTLRTGDHAIVQGIFHDITERRAAQTAAQRHQALLEAVFDNTPFMLCLVDEKGRIERMNRAMASLMETAQPGAFIGDVFGCIAASTPVPERDRNPLCQACALQRTLMESIRLESPQRRIEVPMVVEREGRQREILLSASTALVSLEGRTRLLVCLEDITSNRQLERQFLQAQKMEAIGQLAGGVAHDFNNIIGATMMHLHLLLETPGLEEEMSSALRELQTETRRAANLTRQLLLFGRREVAQIRRVDANDIVEGLLKMLRRLLGEHIDIQFLPRVEEAWMEADPGMLEQVIMNLCVNARDAMPRGGPLRIVTELREVTPDTAGSSPDARVGTFVCLAVQDSGTGIEPEHLSHIFEPFFTTKPAGKGTGLGLATVYGIVRQHQGWVDVESVTGQGTTFRVYLPSTAATEPAVPDSSLAPLPRGTESILVVEDDASLLRTASYLLRTCGYRVRTARNGPEALQQWQDAAGQVDLLFTDVVMPGGLSGIDLAESLRRSKPGLRVVMASGYSPDLVNAGGRPAAGTVFLAKPYTPPALADIIRACLDGTAPSRVIPVDPPGLPGV